MKTLRSLRQFSKEDWLNPLGLALIGYYLAMAVVGLLIPDDILKANAWARELSDFMASIVPQIDRITALGIKRDVNRFYFSVLWAGSPVGFLISLILIWDGRNRGYAMWSMPLAKASIHMAICLATMVGSQWIFWMEDVTNRQLRFLLGNALGRSFWGSVVYVHGVTCFGAGLVIWVGAWVTGYLPRKIKEQRNG